MKMSDLINYKPFFEMYKKGYIIYLSAVARHFSISTKEAYQRCENIKNLGLIKTLYMLRCPICNCTLDKRYYSLSHIDDTTEIGCNHCDTEFIPDLWKDVVVCYERE